MTRQEAIQNVIKFENLEDEINDICYHIKCKSEIGEFSLDLTKSYNFNDNEDYMVMNILKSYFECQGYKVDLLKHSREEYNNFNIYWI